AHRRATDARSEARSSVLLCYGNSRNDSCRLSGRHDTGYCIAAHIAVNTVATTRPSASRCRYKLGENMWTFASARMEDVDERDCASCARLRPYCSFSVVEYDISLRRISLRVNRQWGVRVGPT